MKQFKNIMFVADGSDGEDAVLMRAADLANANEARLRLFDALEVEDFTPSDTALGSAMDSWREAHLKERLDELQELAKAAISKYPSVRVTAKVQTGNTARSAIRTVISDQHDLVVKAPQGGVGRLKTLFGSTDQKLMRMCPCPVWIVRPSASSGFERILAAIEVNPNKPEAESLARKILELSTSLAAAEGAELHVVHALPLAAKAAPKGGQIDGTTVDRILSELRSVRQSALDSLTEAYPYGKTETHLINGEAGDVIAAFAEERSIDLIIIGTVGRSGVPGMLIGNTAEKVLSTVDCSVLALKPEGFRTPLKV